MECGTLAEQGGQLMHCQLTNQNVLGAAITIKRIPEKTIA
jgi:hypothetical protein